MYANERPALFYHYRCTTRREGRRKGASSGPGSVETRPSVVRPTTMRRCARTRVRNTPMIAADCVSPALSEKRAQDAKQAGSCTQVLALPKGAHQQRSDHLRRQNMHVWIGDRVGIHERSAQVACRRPSGSGKAFRGANSQRGHVLSLWTRPVSPCARGLRRLATFRGLNDACSLSAAFVS